MKLFKNILILPRYELTTLQFITAKEGDVEADVWESFLGKVMGICG